MTTHIFGMILTHQGTFSNNRGEGEGTTNTLQKIIRDGDLYSTVSAEAIRYALREGWQEQGNTLNRKTLNHHQVRISDSEFKKWKNNLDDDVLGFMHASKETTSRRGNLEVTRGISTTPWAGEVMQNFASPGSNPGADHKNPIPYAVEAHHTRYQFGFALTPDALGREQNCNDQGEPMRSVHDPEERIKRVRATLDGLCNLRRVGGAHARYFSDYSPEAIILRVTDDPAPRMLYCFWQSDTGELSVRELINKVEAEDIDASELVIGTALDIKELRGVKIGSNGDDKETTVTEGVLKGARLVKGVKSAIRLCLKKVSENQQEDQD